MKTLLWAVLAGVLVGGMPVAAQEKSSPDDQHLLLTRQHRFAMTHARRVEMAETKDDAVAEVAALGTAIEAALAQLDEVASQVGPTYAAQVEAVRKLDLDAQTHWKAANGGATVSVMKQQALAARESVDAAEEAHQKMMKAVSTAKPDTSKPATATVPAADTTKPAVVKQ